MKTEGLAAPSDQVDTEPTSLLKEAAGLPTGMLQ